MVVLNGMLLWDWGMLSWKSKSDLKNNVEASKQPNKNKPAQKRKVEEFDNPDNDESRTKGKWISRKEKRISRLK
jgi:hypothetical protein